MMTYSITATPISIETATAAEPDTIFPVIPASAAIQASTAIDQPLHSMANSFAYPDLPPARLLIHSGGCPLYVWWARGKRRNRLGRQWLSLFAYLEYRLGNGASAYVQYELRPEQFESGVIWQALAQLPIPGACTLASRKQLIQSESH